MSIEEARQSVGSIVRVRADQGRHSHRKGKGKMPARILGVVGDKIEVQFLVGEKHREKINPGTATIWRSRNG